jgi:putative ABC transport system substrate-binding protein
MTTRRAFVVTLAGGLLVIPLAAQGHPGGKTWRVGFLTGGGRPPDGAPTLALRQALQEHGYVERQNVIYLGRWAEAHQDRLPELAGELVGLKVDMIVTVGGPASEAARRYPAESITVR